VDFLKEKFPEAQFSNLVNGDTEILVDKKDYLDVAKACLEAGYAFCSCVSAIDWKDRLTLVSSLSRINPAEINAPNIHIKVDLPRTGARVASITSLFPGANFHERETYDMYGIRFDGHPNHRRILLPDNWQGGFPLLKDFVDKRPKRPRLVRHRYAE
jgi:NADH:ubiquinone oxidoreductase subunit C